MAVPYDAYYETENLFGAAYPELLTFFESFPQKGKVLDLGCGQGRDAIPLARLGFDVTGIDNSKVGIAQMNELAKAENLPLQGVVADVYAYTGLAEYDFVLLDSMFHFAKKDKKKETEFIQRILIEMKSGGVLVICIQDTGNKIAILNEILEAKKGLDRLREENFIYVYEDQESGHRSETPYRMIVVQK